MARKQMRVAVVTGGTGALGGAIVSALLAEGWSVHVPWRTRSSAAALKKSAGAAARHLHLHEADVAVEEDVERLFEGVDKASKRLDALCNIAGGFGAAPIDEIVVSAWDEMLATNATTAFLCSRAAVPRLRAAGGGRIVNVSSASALDPKPGMTAYVAAKTAVAAMTRALAVELGPDRITVNAIAPTTIDTPANRKAMSAADRSGWVSLHDLAATVLWLLSKEAEKVTGTIVRAGR